MISSRLFLKVSLTGLASILLSFTAWKGPEETEESEVPIYGSKQAVEQVRPTYNLGGVKEPSRQELSRMQKGDYVLHAYGGELIQVPAEKTQLAYDPEGHIQRVQVAVGPDSAIYVASGSLMSKSTDGGRTWEAHPAGLKAGPNCSFQVLSDGSFVGVRSVSDEDARIIVLASQDEGRNWQQISEVSNPAQCPVRYPGSAFCRLSDDTLILPVESRAYHGIDPAYVHRSTDGGKTWEGPVKLTTGEGFLGGRCYETMITELASGRLMAVIRYHGPVVPQWPLVDPNRTPWYKTVFLADSEDRGKTWKNLRPLTNVHGQCHGHGVGLPDGRVVVTHDHRYPPGTPCGRAMISRDEGRSWEDEVYYLYYGSGQSGFSQSVVLEDNTVLTLGATSDYQEAKGWHDWTGQADLWAIRWKPRG